MTHTSPTVPIIALEKRLRDVPQVKTLGVRPNFTDYSEDERKLIQQAPKIFYPSSLYAELFDTIGKATFPNHHTYKFSQDKIKQTFLFNMAGIPHPRTRVFYGRRQKAKILDYFDFPFIAKIPRGSALGRGVFLISAPEDLERYLKSPGPAYIQEYLPIDRDIRAVVIGKRLVHAYWRIAPPEDFRTNVAGGGQVDLSPVPEEAIRLALQTARLCKWDDVGIDICRHHGRYYVLEGNMKYGREGFRQAGIDYQKLLLELIQQGEI